MGFVRFPACAGPGGQDSATPVGDAGLGSIAIDQAIRPRRCSKATGGGPTGAWLPVPRVGMVCMNARAPMLAAGPGGRERCRRDEMDTRTQFHPRLRLSSRWSPHRQEQATGSPNMPPEACEKGWSICQQICYRPKTTRKKRPGKYSTQFSAKKISKPFVRKKKIVYT